MSSGAAPRPSPQRTIGEILLANGYVDQEHLDRALERQQETGLPLGQILVEAGAITRLELASALAVQWSDMPIAVRPEDDGRRSLASEDGAERKVIVAAAADPAWQHELDSSMRELETRLGRLESSLGELDGRAELGRVNQIVEQLEARLASSEAQLAEATSRAAEGVTPASLEERLGTLVTAVETALSRSDEIEARVTTLAPRIEEVSGEVGRTDAELERRSTGFTEVVNALAARIHAAPTAAQLDELRRAVAGLTERSASEPPEPEPVHELAQGVAELSARVDELEASMQAERPAPDGNASFVEATDALARRIAEATEAWESERAILEQRLAGLVARIERSENAAGAQPTAAALGTAVPDTAAADDLNRLWFAVERISLQLTEHHRDIDTLLARGQDNDRIDELTARLDDLEALGGAGLAGQAESESGERPEPDPHAVSRVVEHKLRALEKSTGAEREKLLTQVEQMLGSLEWRLQRLESADTPAPTLGS
jgi:DNA repair exonuclease SbcCD ATPase subunit